MLIRYRLTQQDFVSACTLSILKRSAGSIVAACFLPGLGLLLVASALFTHTRDADWSGVLFGCLPGLLLMVSPFFLFPFTFRRNYTKNPLLREERTCEADDKGLHFTGSSFNSQISWSHFSKFAQNDRVFILFQQGNQLIVPIPKCDLSPAQLDEFTALLKAHLPGK